MMKRLATLVLALCLSLGAASQASAIEVVPSGVMDFVFVYTNSYGFSTSGESNEGLSDRFAARQRSRIQIDFIANENLRGVMMLQFGTWEWGADEAAALDTTKEGAKVRRLYIDFNFPDSPLNVKMGLMDLVLPYATFGQPVFGNHVAAVTATAQVSDNASLTAFWARPYRNANASELKDNDMDVFGLWANLDFENFSIAPWAAYASIGSKSGWFDREFDDWYSLDDYSTNETADWWGAGLALKVMPSDNLTIKFDAMYANLSNDGKWARLAPRSWEDAPEGSGYYFALAVDYALDWGTPGLFAIYSSGDDADDGNDIGRLPGLGYDDKLFATRMAFAGSMTCANDSYLNVSGLGLWLVGVQIADLSFMENVTHTARIAYIRGTNNIESRFINGIFDGSKNFGNVIPLAYEDQAWELGFDTYWQMYDNLTVGLELGYIYLDAANKADVSGLKRDERYNEESVYSANLIFRFGF